MKPWKHTPLLQGMMLMVAGTASATEPEAVPAHLIVVTKAVDALPADIVPLFRSNVERLQEAAREPATVWPRDSKLRNRNRWHHVALDAAVTDPGHDERVEAAKVFPRDQSAALRVYRQASRHGGGTLPWAIEECFRELTSAFESGGEQDIVAWAGYAAHFAADAADPCRVTADVFRETRSPSFGSTPLAHPTSDYVTVRDRVGVGLMNRKGGTYASGISLTWSDYVPVVDPTESAFELMSESLGLFDRVADFDRAALSDAGASDRKSFDANREAYFMAMNESCGSLLVERLDAGARLAAGLIGGAWEAAGQPTLEAIRSRSGAAGAEGATQPATASGPIVGSRNSTVFHSPDCSFVKQIADDNLISFPSSLDARQAGRRACKQCQPK